MTNLTRGIFLFILATALAVPLGCEPGATMRDDSTDTWGEGSAQGSPSGRLFNPQGDPADDGDGTSGSDSDPDPVGEPDPPVGDEQQPVDDGSGSGGDSGDTLRDDGDATDVGDAEYDPEQDDYDPSYPEPGTQSCSEWQDCAPRYGNPDSGYQCLESICTCDPGGSFEQECGAGGGYWIAQECYCARNVTALPNKALEDTRYCWFTWRDTYYVWCEADVWVDTSYYEEECYWDYYYEYEVCDYYYVDDGYWEPGICHSEPYWEEVCYDGYFYGEW